ncbi:hypothetical protein KKI95_15955 [Xenorhabdus bovienii]|uniref:hypothetical protein n=1 Tax=Xenorhabdus bovienii TaxID=40576 RepID=UPI0023B2495B|nr:hypothetical protein [Xenorhabdus bovienii]MDE9437381.1 hypothetical protein [Xenorhabdus bovienii]MDE9499270.1 hypothetical protein [Xenorhabdus bovienii]MDE9545634.1 hypothetical protein [Xenorhabdus bovienii]
MDFLIREIMPGDIYIDGVRYPGLNVELVMTPAEGDGYRFVTNIFLRDSKNLTFNEINDKVIEIAKEKLKMAVSQI